MNRRNKGNYAKYKVGGFKNNGNILEKSIKVFKPLEDKNNTLVKCIKEKK